MLRIFIFLFFCAIFAASYAWKLRASQSALHCESTALQSQPQRPSEVLRALALLKRTRKQGLLFFRRTRERALLTALPVIFIQAWGVHISGWRTGSRVGLDVMGCRIPSPGVYTFGFRPVKWGFRRNLLEVKAIH